MLLGIVIWMILAIMSRHSRTGQNSLFILEIHLHNGHHNRGIILEKLDQIFGNSCWFFTWPTTCSKFLPKYSSYHNVMVVHSAGPLPKLKASFNFLNLWAIKGDFLGLVVDTQQTLVDGNLMYKAYQDTQIAKA